jgi:hypothetical protein
MLKMTVIIVGMGFLDNRLFFIYAPIKSKVVYLHELFKNMTIDTHLKFS